MLEKVQHGRVKLVIARGSLVQTRWKHKLAMWATLCFQITFTAIVRSRPERIVDVPQRSKVAVVTSFADRAALSKAFSGADLVLTALGERPTSNKRSAMLSELTESSSSTRCLPLYRGQPASRAIRFFSSMPGRIGRGAREQQAVVDALGKGAFSVFRGHWRVPDSTPAARTRLRWPQWMAWRSELLDASLV